MTYDLCKNLGFDFAIFPNILGLSNQGHAIDNVDILKDNLEYSSPQTNECTGFIGMVACSNSYHRCNATYKGYKILLCKDYCEG